MEDHITPAVEEGVAKMETKENTEKKRDYFLPLSILLAGIMISGSVLYATRGSGGGSATVSQGLNSALAMTDRDVILGNPKAPVTLIEYGDYQCPFCAKFFAETEPLIRDEFVNTGKVQMVYRNFAFLGPESFAAAEAAECAKDQNKFWAFHDKIYAAERVDGQEFNGNLNRNLFVKTATEVEMDVKQFEACIDSGKYKEVVQEETIAGRDAGVDSTPTAFVNGEKVRGALPYADGSFGKGFRTIILEAIEAAK